MTNQNHPFHLVTPSPWPIIISLSIFNNLIFIISWFHNLPLNSYYCPLSYFFTCCTHIQPLFLFFSMPNTIICMYLWWRDILRESTFQGCHSNYVHRNMKIGMILFIISEIFFFISFFWAYFHSSLSPSIEIGQLWPPKGVTPFNPFDIPLMNTIILITSGLTITWAHHSLINMNLNESKKSLLLTIILGIYFSILQLFEYLNSPFTISDSIYGSTFFIATGFHGIHVIIGTLFLMISLIRLFKLHFSSYHHFGFEAASWYWHFVDVIWLFLYISIYWWSF